MVLPQEKIGDIEQGLPRQAVANPAARVTADMVVKGKSGAQQRDAETTGNFDAV